MFKRTEDSSLLYRAPLLLKATSAFRINLQWVNEINGVVIIDLMRLLSCLIMPETINFCYNYKLTAILSDGK